ncbi:DNA primase family protein, partial [Clostridium subterminale]|uniref:DNA primase family protein n=1 Tax=Clostridium subterminale TaxID=1550 RepID=UPI0031E2F519
VKTKILEPHTPGYISDFQLDINYMDNPSNNHIWDGFLDTLTEKDQEIKDFLQEWYGLILSNYDASIVKSFTYLTGKGDSGKSIPIKVLNALLTDKLFMALDVCKLGDRFSLGNVANKRLIACGDVVGRFIDESSLGMMKQLTGGDIISIEKKGKDPLSIHYRGLMMFSANHIPSFNGDLGRHVFERINIIPCNNVIPAEKRDKLFHEKILQEKDYIFKWALEGLERLINNDFRFTQSKKMIEAKEEYSLDVDSVRAFIRRSYDITESKQDRCKTKTVYEEYNNYCLEEDLIPVSKKNFKPRLLNLNIGFTVYCGSEHYTHLRKKDYIEVEEDTSL